MYFYMGNVFFMKNFTKNSLPYLKTVVFQSKKKQIMRNLCAKYLNNFQIIPTSSILYILKFSNIKNLNVY